MILDLIASRVGIHALWHWLRQTQKCKNQKNTNEPTKLLKRKKAIFLNQPTSLKTADLSLFSRQITVAIGVKCQSEAARGQELGQNSSESARLDCNNRIQGDFSKK